MIKTTLSAEELRKNPRFPSTATITIINPETACITEGQCLDVSETGLKVKTSNPLDIGANLSLSILDKDVLFYAVGEIRYCNPKDDTYEVGMSVDFKQTLPANN